MQKIARALASVVLTLGLCAPLNAQSRGGRTPDPSLPLVQS